MWDTIQRVAWTALVSTFGQTVSLILPLLLFGWLIHLSSSLLEKGAVRLLGLKAYLWLLAWPGTAVHELGHALFCPLFGHKITGIQLFSFSQRKQNAGYVTHTYSGRNPYHLAGNFFISVGPLVLGSVVIFIVIRYLAGLPLTVRGLAGGGKILSADGGFAGWVVDFFSQLWRLAVSLARHLDFKDWRTYLSAWLVLSVGSAMTLSPQDISSAAGGLGVILALLFGVNLIAAALGYFSPDNTGLLRIAAAACLLMTLVLSVCLTAVLLIRLLCAITRR
ncbi:MAG TPA: hypothetical protein VJ417_00200 [Candidatus Glassbacteria bacterium]|nr:hypothetical protein [Candidatus Glassbacteria bacterium]